ncbi:Bug family tripartite tricarboxylate transporter substrate binding protein [Hydrogenophaga pseudoflava]|uniref:Tripartite tricarboxylate transporter family receptor n=1 Tax=Hydrogenophaga pseudoflava TaxID=47421 RepID=A0A4P6X206_HYDPS|nr:tripartite tricarboxylate transporter substrate binding protein [Hydrogenophaga pseudoflava]QBM29139.1 Tripartite tricarboxylate transporter family receptor [Hydrogenophaga pseudoflava]
MIPTPRKALQLLAVLAAFGTGAAQAQEYPTKPVRIVVPYPAGGFNDTLGRLAAKHLGDYWKKPVIVDNKPGAGTMIGTKEVAGAAPNGHTILVVQFPYAANPWLYKNIAYDTQKAFAPVLLAGRSPMLLVTHAQSPYRTASELLAAARAKPNVLTYGSSGAGSSNHLAMALFETATGTQMRQVPYKGSTPMLTDLAGGQFDVAMDLLPHAMPFMQSGRVRPLAIAAPKRSPLLPDVPTAAEAGIPGYEVSSWHGFVVPSGTPQSVIDKLNTDLNRMLHEDEVQKAFAAQGVVPDGGTPAQFRGFIDGQMALWKKVVSDRNITVD